MPHAWCNGYTTLLARSFLRELGPLQLMRPDIDTLSIMAAVDDRTTGKGHPCSSEVCAPNMVLCTVVGNQRACRSA